MKTKQQLRDELAKVLLLRRKENPATIIHINVDDTPRKTTALTEAQADAQAIINHLTPVIDELVELVTEMRGVDGTAKWLMARYKADALLSGLKEGV